MQLESAIVAPGEEAVDDGGDATGGSNSFPPRPVAFIQQAAMRIKL